MDDELDKALAKLRGQQQPPNDMDAVLAKIRTGSGSSRSFGAPEAPPAVRPDVGRALPRNRKNPTGDIQAATANPGQQAKFIGAGLTANALNSVQGFPGVERAEAGMMSLGSKMTKQPMGYGESLATLRHATEGIPEPIRIAEQMAVGGRYLPTKFSPAKTGMALGAGSQAASADSMSLPERGIRTGIGGVAGGLLGKVLDVGQTAGRVASGKDLKGVLRPLEEAKLATGARVYPPALAGSTTGTPQVQALAQDPKFAPIFDHVLSTEKYAGKAADDPEVLHEVFRSLSDERWASKLATQGQPLRGNAKRLAADEAQRLQQRFLGAVDTQMPGYRGAVGEYARAARPGDLAKQANRTVQAEARLGGPTERSIARKLTMEDLPRGATAGEQQALKRGALSGAKGQMAARIPGVKIPVPWPSLKLQAASDALRRIDPNDSGSLLAKVLLTGGNAAANKP